MAHIYNGPRAKGQGLRAVGRTLALLAVATGAEAAELGWTSVTVRLYHHGVVSEADEARALATAAGILAAADVSLRWTHCHASVRSQEPSDPRCAQPLAPGERALRLTRTRLPAARTQELALGEALLTARGTAPAFATLHLERVDRLARRSGADAGVLLGRAMAHELTHLLTGIGRHAPAGLMRPVWSARELARERAADWALDMENVAAIRSVASVASSPMADGPSPMAAHRP